MPCACIDLGWVQVAPSKCGFAGMLSADDEKKLRRRCPELTIGELTAAMRRCVLVYLLIKLTVIW